MAGPSDSSIAANLGVPASFLKHMRRVIENSKNPDDDLEYDSEVAGPSPEATYLVVPGSFFKHIWRVKSQSNDHIVRKSPSPVEEPGPYDVYIPAPAVKELDWQIAGQPYSLMASHEVQSSQTSEENSCSLKTKREARPSRFGLSLPTWAPSSIAAYLGVPGSSYKHIWRVSYKPKKQIAQKLSSPVEGPGRYDIYVPAPAVKELDWQISGLPFCVTASFEVQSLET